MQNQPILWRMFTKINQPKLKKPNTRSVYHVSSRKNNSEIIQPEKKEIIQPKKMGLLVENPVYKPFRYPWCYDAW